MRESGILLPVSSLPSPFGIGCFSQEAYEWIDYLKKCGQHLWQILPLGPVSYGDSPYQSFSTFAGNPLYISLVDLIEEELLTWEECEGAGLHGDGQYVDYGLQFEKRYPLLRLAFIRSACESDEDFFHFCHLQKFWLDDYALYMALKEKNEWKAWMDWDEDLRLRRPERIRKEQEDLKEEILFYKFLQFLFFRQWEKLRAYANENEVRIIGDLPIYVAMDSADAWTHPDLFQFDEEMNPIAVAGCPPDAFSEDGQLWGNPLYRWEAHRAEGYRWWLLRLQQAANWYDIVRIDHFRGFDEYYAIPYGEETAKNGEWEPGPGMELFEELKKVLPDLEIIAEDLGLMTDSVRKLVKDSGFPNMKVLQFAFGSDAKNDHLPHWHKENMVIYTGTHDNETLMQHLGEAGEYEKRRIREFLNSWDVDDRLLCDRLIRMAHGSVAKYCIIPMQDYLYVGAEGRLNHPSTLGGINWQWRMQKHLLAPDIEQKIRYITDFYAR